MRIQRPHLHFPDALASTAFASVRRLHRDGVVRRAFAAGTGLRLQFRDVVETDIMLIPYDYRILRLLSVRKDQLDPAVPVEPRFFKQVLDAPEIHSVDFGRSDGIRPSLREDLRLVDMSSLEQPAEVRLQELPRVHPRKDSVRIDKDVYCPPTHLGRKPRVVGQPWHGTLVLHLTDNALVAMTRHELVAAPKGNDLFDLVREDLRHASIDYRRIVVGAKCDVRKHGIGGVIVSYRECIPPRVLEPSNILAALDHAKAMLPSVHQSVFGQDGTRKRLPLLD